MLCSVTTFTNCRLLCVWQERQDCHLCGMVPLKVSPKHLFFVKRLYQNYLCAFRTNLVACQLLIATKTIAIAVSETGRLYEKSEVGKHKACSLITMHYRDILLLSSHSVLCSMYMNKCTHEQFYALMSK